VLQQEYLYARTGGFIVSLSHLIRESAITAIESGNQQITVKLMDTIELDHAAEQEADQRRQNGKKTKRTKP
jgi:hypothetical protein